MFSAQAGATKLEANYPQDLSLDWPAHSPSAAPGAGSLGAQHDRPHSMDWVLSPSKWPLKEGP